MFITGDTLDKLVEVINDPLTHIINENLLTQALVCASGEISAIECQLEGILIENNKISLEYKVLSTQSDGPLEVIGTHASVSIN